MPDTTTLACACGRFHIALVGAPFITTECHCNSCRDAARRMGDLPTAFSPADENGGTPFVLYRKDRISLPEGTDGLKAYRLTEKSPTRRVITTCCNSPIFLEFQSGHWLSLYANLWPRQSRPAIAIRTMTSDLPDSHLLDDTVPSGKRSTAGFYWKLLAAWIAMGFKVPKIDIKEAY